MNMSRTASSLLLCLSTFFADAALAETTACEVAVELDVASDSAIELAPLRNALSTYLRDLDCAVVTTLSTAASSEGSGPKQYVLRLREEISGARFAVSLSQSDSQAAPVTWMLAVRQSLTASFYRELALKTRASIRVMTLSTERVPKTTVETSPAAQAITAAPATPSPPPSSFGFSAHVFTLGTTALDLTRLLPAFGAEIALRWGRASFGAWFSRSLAVQSNLDVAWTSAVATRVVVEARFLPFSFADGFFSLGGFAAGGAEVATVKSNADRAEATVVSPLFALGVCGEIALARHWAISLSVLATGFPRNTRILAANTAIYATGWIEPGVRLGVKASL